MKYTRVDSNPFPTPDTVDVLAEVADFRAGRDLGRSSLTLKSLANYTDTMHPDSAESREALVHLAANAIARIELIDRKEFVD